MTCQQQLQQTVQQMATMRDLISQSRNEFVNYLNVYNPLKDDDDVSLVMVYKQFIAKEIMCYTTLNKFKDCRALMAGFIWVPSHFKSKLFSFKDYMSHKHGFAPHMVEREPDAELTPPTYFRENEFTFPAQMIIDQYEIPKYKEVNPALFTVISFPFLFGVMFGDVFAGSLLLSGGLYLTCCKFEPSHPMAGAVPFRYLLLLMGFFACFCGVIYNDFTSVGMYLFGDSCWELPVVGQVTATLKPDCVYPIGVDPSWYMATNEILFINSVKMKIALILGVMQMTLGIVMKGFNDIYFKRPVDLIFEFIPQVCMFMALFGFMDFMVVQKWLTDYT
jgi:V-type H+-transporting ATPase subunit a